MRFVLPIAAILFCSPLAADPTRPESLGHLSTHFRIVRHVLEVQDPADAFWFFTSGPFTNVEVQVHGAPGPIASVRLYESRARRWTNYPGGSSVQFKKQLNSGWHYLRIDSGSSANDVPYTLTVRGIDPGYFPDTPSSFNYARPMKFRAASSVLFYALARDRVDTSDRVDVFQLDMPFPFNNLRIYTIDAYGGGAYLELFDAAYNLLAMGKNLDLDGTPSLESVLPAGRYFVRVTMDSVTRSTDLFTTSFGTGYSLYVTSESTPADLAGNDFLHEYNLGTVGNPITFRDFLNRDKGDPRDVFQFQLRSAAQVAISVRNQPVPGLPAGDADVWLGDGSYRTVWMGSSVGDEARVLTLPAGMYHLVINHMPTGRAVTAVATEAMFYRLNINIVPQAVTDIGANSPAMAFYYLPSRIIYPGVNSLYAPHTETIGGGDPADFYRVIVQGRPQQQMVGFHAEVTPALPGNLTLQLWQNGPGPLRQIAASVRTAGNVVILDAGLAPGTYIIGVVDQSGAPSTFTLNLQTRW